MSFGSVILLLGIYPKEAFANVYNKDFAQDTVQLSVVAKDRKQPK